MDSSNIMEDIGNIFLNERNKLYFELKKGLQQVLRCESEPIKKVIFNNPATIIYWWDGSKTVVKCDTKDTYDKEKGFLLCYLKGIVGNKTLLQELDKWVNKKPLDKE